MNYLWCIIILLVIALIVRLYNKYSPHVDYILYDDRHLVLLYYNSYEENNVVRKYIKLFEVWL